MADRIGVPLELEGFDVGGTEVVGEELVVTVVSTRRPACLHCGSLDVVGHGLKARRIRDIPCGRPTVLRWLQRRLCWKD